MQNEEQTVNGLQVGFIGAGRMGSGIIRTLLGAGYTVTVYDVNRAAAESCAEAGAQIADSPAEAADGAEFVCTSLPMPRDLESLYSAGTDLLSVLSPRSVCIDFSTVDVDSALRASRCVAEAGAGFVSSPLGGNPADAAGGTLRLFPGGPEESVSRATPLLDTLGSVHPMGTIEAAVSFKLICNLIGITNVAVLAEGLVLGLKAGIDPEVLGAALSAAGAGSHQLDLRWPAMTSQDFTPRFSIDLAIKDLGLAVHQAAASGIPLAVGSGTLRTLEATRDRGDGALDIIAMLKAIAPSASPGE